MRLRKRSLGLLALALLTAAFPFGPLFPWSPWKPGYHAIPLARADVFIPAGTTAPPAYRQIDAYIQAAEHTLQLSAPKRIAIVLTPTWTHFRRLMPHMRSTGIGAVTLATGGIVYVTPRIAARNFDHGEFLRHEICHAVIHQNQSVLAAFRISQVEWLSEGLAVMFGNQQAYVTRDEMLARARREDILPAIDPQLRDPRTFQIRYAYQLWRYFCEFLIEHYGRETFQRYLRAVMADPSAWRTQFQSVFQTPFVEAVKSYQEKLRS
ncbi:MAG: hypothetical protein JNK48_01440 [Bryobacterales bacterium]|nr:hypothetical protein [Bryobacterales bacterium]